jgi:hypothetical protein
MNNSLKRVIVAGLVAGIVSGIIAIICHILVLNLGLTPPWRASAESPISRIVESYIILNVIWGLIFGIIYSKIDGAIPARGLRKGFCYGLIIFLFTAVRDATFWYPYGFVYEAISWLFIAFFSSIVYGTLLEAIYKTEAQPVGNFDIQKGSQVGALTGLIGGIAAFLSAVPANMWILKLGTVVLETDFLIGQAMLHIGLNTIWSTIFGIIFTKVYDVVPGKSLFKGLIYGLTYFLITSFHAVTYYFFLATMPHVFHSLIIGISNTIVFGLVLGYFYKK